MKDLLDAALALTPEKRAAFAELLRRSLGPPPATRPEPIAIIGMACRFPGGVHLPEDFLTLLRERRSPLTTVPSWRWDAAAFYDPDPNAQLRTVMREGGFLQELRDFDAAFFGISPREADAMDPQQRLLLEVGWEALERAGLPLKSISGGSAGVFIGIGLNDYGQVGPPRNDSDPRHFDFYHGSGNHLCISANRLSFQWDLRGPSMAIDTACSSSLVALHMACQSLRAGECPIALVGGVNVMLSPANTLRLRPFLSPTGRCWTFDARADGYVRGEGAAMLVLKPLSRAVADGDPIHAVVRGSAVGQDGASSGLTVPRGIAQEEVIRKALTTAGIDPRDVGYVEAHGTGTPLGDPIEANALGAVLERDRGAGRPCLLGSVKTNIGHLEAAAGLAGLVKVALMLEHKELVPGANFETPNPDIDFEGLGLEVAVRSEPWRCEGPRIAGVSSFGFGGTNAHVLLEEAPARTSRASASVPAAIASPAYVLPLSARDPSALRALAKSTADVLREHDLEDVCFTAGVRRTHHHHRIAAVGRDASDLVERLVRFSEGDPALAAGQSIPTDGVVLVFSGQGSPWPGMGRELYASEPAFAETLEACDAVAREVSGFSILEELAQEEATSRLGDTDRAQPCLVALEIGLTALWKHYGLRVAGVIGHSVGELAAACAAGVLSREDAIRVACERGRQLHAAKGGGAMAEVSAAEEEIRSVLTPWPRTLAVAAVNGPSTTVLSGTPEEISEASERLRAAGSNVRALPLHYAFHGPQMDRFVAPFAAALQGLRSHAPQLPFYSTVSGTEVTVLDPAYWTRNLREPVLFLAAVRRAIERGHRDFVEVGPHPVLTPSILAIFERDQVRGFACGSLRRRQPARQCLLSSVAQLFVRGHDLDFAAALSGRGRCIRLPNYPWQRSRHWVDLVQGTAATRTPLTFSTTKSDDSGWSGELVIGTDRQPYLADHLVFERVVVPAAFLLTAVLSGAEAARGKAMELCDVVFPRALTLSASTALVLEIAKAGQFVLQTKRHDTAFPHALGKLEEAHPTSRLRTLDVARCQEPLPTDELENLYRRSKVTFGPTFRWIRSAHRGQNELLARLERPASLDDEGKRVHPAELDACLQALGIATAEVAGASAFLPFSVDRLRVHDGPRTTSSTLCHVVVTERTHERIAGDIALFDEAGHLLVEIEGVRMRRAREQDLASSDQAWPAWVYERIFRPLPGGSGEAMVQGHWVVFADRSGASDAIAATIRERGSCTVVRVEHEAESSPDGSHLLSPREEGAFALLFDELASSGRKIAGVVYAWSLDVKQRSDVDDLICHGALRVLQLMARRAEHAPVLFLTRGACAATAEDTVNPWQAILGGLVRTARQEHPSLDAVLVDLDPRGDDIGLLSSELSRPDRDVHEIALRGGARLGACIVRSSTLPVTPSPHAAVRPGGMYLVTGGLGALGLATAQWLSARGAGHILLLGRHGIQTAAQQDAVTALEAGASVTVATCDVADALALEHIIEGLEKAGHVLRGVFHAAGVVDDGMVANLEPSRFARAFRAKVDGVLALETLTQRRNVDSFVLYSSAASWLGHTGQATYAAANAFMDAFARRRAALGLPALSVAWGTWEDGMVARLGESEKERLYKNGLRLMPKAECTAALESLLVAGRVEAGIIDINWTTFAASRPKDGLLRELAFGSTPASSGAFARALAELPAAARTARIEEWLAEQCARVLGHTSAGWLDPTKGFLELGMDSLMVVELRGHVEHGTGTRLSATMAFDHPNIVALGAWLLDELELALPSLASETPATETIALDDLDDGALLTMLDEELALSRKANKGR